MIQSVSNIPEKELFKGLRARFIHTENVTIGHVSIDKDAALPEHSHVHEQITHVVAGELEMIIDGQPSILKPGMSAIIPSNIKHSAKAITDCKVIDTFCPVREDYK